MQATYSVSSGWLEIFSRYWVQPATPPLGLFCEFFGDTFCHIPNIELVLQMWKIFFMSDRILTWRSVATTFMLAPLSWIFSIHLLNPSLSIALLLVTSLTWTIWKSIILSLNWSIMVYVPYLALCPGLSHRPSPDSHRSSISSSDKEVSSSHPFEHGLTLPNFICAHFYILARVTQSRADVSFFAYYCPTCRASMQ